MPNWQGIVAQEFRTPGSFPVPFFCHQAFLTHTQPERQTKDWTLFGRIILGSPYLFEPVPLKLHGQYIVPPL